MSDQYPFFAYLSRMRYINRWGLMRNTFQENIQEHSHMVAVLAHALAVIRRDVFGGDADPVWPPQRPFTTTRRRFSPATCPPPSSTTTPTSGTPTGKWSSSPPTSCCICCRRPSAPPLTPAAGGLRPRAQNTGQGRRQALGPHQMRGGAQGGQRRIQAGRGADAGGPAGLWSARAGLLSGALPARLRADAG